MLKKQLYLFIVFCAALSTAKAADIQHSVDTFAASSALKHASVGVGIYDMASHQMIAGHNVDVSQLTASTMKTVTSSTALLKMGKDFRFHTQVYTTGKVDRHGHLNGDIIIKGGGDPTLGSRHFKRDTAFVDAVCIALQEKGIKQIKGRIIMNDSLITYPYVAHGWMVEDLAWDYGTGIHAINFADNDFNVKIDVSKDTPSILSLTPNLNYMQFGCSARIITDSDSLTSTGLDAFADVDKNYYHLFGNVRRRERPISLDCANTAPALLLRNCIISALNSNDIKLRDKDIDSEDDNQNFLLLDYPSPTLGEIVKSLLSRSDNLYAEGVLRAIAINAGREGSIADATSTVRKFWKSQGIDISGLFMRDGSGLARNGKFSPRFLNEMLAKAEEMTPEDAKFSSFLPCAGVSGTVKSLMSRTEYKGKFALKSGSYSDVQCFAGYYPVEQPRYTVVVMVSNFTGARSNLITVIERLLSNIAEEVGQE